VEVMNFPIVYLQKRVAVKAGVAHYVADEQGNSKFEYIKK
jgi:hypothetical protein